MSESKLLQSAREAYKILTVEQKQGIEGFCSSMSDAEICALRTMSFDEIMQTVSIKLISASFEDALKSEGSVATNFTKDRDLVDKKLSVLALAWVHVNEFWLKVEEDTNE